MSRILAHLVEHHVKFAARHTGEQAGFEVHKYLARLFAVQLLYRGIRNGAAGIRTRAADLPEKAAVRGLVQHR